MILWGNLQVRFAHSWCPKEHTTSIVKIQKMIRLKLRDEMKKITSKILSVHIINYCIIIILCPSVHSTFPFNIYPSIIFQKPGITDTKLISLSLSQVFYKDKLNVDDLKNVSSWKLAEWEPAKVLALYTAAN